MQFISKKSLVQEIHSWSAFHRILESNEARNAKSLPTLGLTITKTQINSDGTISCSTFLGYQVRHYKLHDKLIPLRCLLLEFGKSALTLQNDVQETCSTEIASMPFWKLTMSFYFAERSSSILRHNFLSNFVGICQHKIPVLIFCLDVNPHRLHLTCNFHDAFEKQFCVK